MQLYRLCGDKESGTGESGCHPKKVRAHDVCFTYLTVKGLDQQWIENFSRFFKMGLETLFLTSFSV